MLSPISSPDRRLRRRRVCPAEPPRGARRSRARDPPRGVPSGRLASFLAPPVPRGPQSELAFRPPTRGPSPPASRDLRGAGDQIEAGFPAGRRPDRRNLRRSHPAASRPPRPGRDASGRPEGVPLSARLPQSPRGPRMGGCLTFHYPPSSEPAGAGSVCLRGDRGLCAPRGPTPPSVPGWIASSCGFPRPVLGIITRSRRPESRGELGYPHHYPKGHPLYLPSLTFHCGRDPRARWRSATQCLLLRGARGLSRGLQLTGDQVPSSHEAPEFAFHVFHQYSQSII